jgi:hypothetical protein
MRLLLLCIIIGLAATSAFATNVIFLSEEGWCEFYLNGKEAGDIQLNDHRLIMEDTYPGTYELKVHDAFNKLWYEDTLIVPDVKNMVIQIEPDSFEILASGFENPPKKLMPNKDKKATTIRSEVKKYPIADLSSLLYVTTEPEDCAVWVEGRKVGTAPYVDFDPPTGSLELEIRRTGYEPIEELVKVEEGSVTHIHIEVK